MILTEQTITGFTFNEELSASIVELQGAFTLTAGQWYTVNWDGTARKRCAYSLTYGEVSYIAIGNESMTTQGGDLVDPFVIAYAPDSGNCVFIAYDLGESHKVGIQTARAPASVKLKDWYGKDHTFEDVPTLYVRDADGIATPFSAGLVGEDITVPADFSDGDMVLSPEDGDMVRAVTVQAPEALVPEHVKRGVEIAGIMGTFAGDMQEKTVELAMADGDQVIEADPDTVLTKVIVTKPETLIPENIAEGVNIGGIVGTLGADKSSEPRIEYTRNESGEIVRAKLYNMTQITGCSELTSLVEVDMSECPNLTTIAAGAFFGCSSLTSLTFPDTVVSIGHSAFRGCTALTNIEFLGTLKAIGASAFYDCTALQTFTSAGCFRLTIGDSAFRGCKELASLTFGDNHIYSIGTYAFYNCYKLASLDLGEVLGSIGYYAFYMCYTLASITIPDSVTSIGYRAFQLCAGLKTIVIGSLVAKIGDNAFLNTGLTSATFRDTGGWVAKNSETATSGTNLSSSSLANPSTAATWLKSSYVSKWWINNTPGY